MNTIGMIDVTDCELPVLIRAAYSLSRQKGMGTLDPLGRIGMLSDGQVGEIIDRSKNDPLNAVLIDDLNGRNVQFHVRRAGDRLYIDNHWPEHSDHELAVLLTQAGLSADLIETARATYDTYERDCIEKALRALKDGGGTLEDDWRPDHASLGDDVAVGLQSAQQRGLVNGEDTEHGKLWTLPKDE